MDPAKFAGRETQLRAAIHTLYNFGSILITGERGIGKSSFANQLRAVALGELSLLEKLGLRLPSGAMRRVVSETACDQDWGLVDILDSLESRLLDQFSLDDVTLTTRQKWAVDLRLLAYEEESERSPRLAKRHADHFLSIVEECGTQCVDTESFCFIIDEVDRLRPEVHLAPFLKVLVETAQLRSSARLSFILAGQEGVMERFMAQHPSSQRVFEEFELPRMPDDEIRTITRNALAGTGVVIDPRADAELVRLANGCPEPVQLVGYHAFEVNQDAVIDMHDLQAGVAHAMQTLRRRTYEALAGRAGSRLDLDIIRAVASEESGLSATEVADRIATPPSNRTRSSTRQQTRWRGLVDSSVVAKHLGELETLGVLVRDRSRYCIADPLIRAYALLAPEGGQSA